MSNTKIVIALGILFFVSILDLLPDPYHHKEKVNFWEWSRQEIIELLTGERE